MIFKKLIITDFGLYRGTNEFNLAPDAPDRPIILFGGKNGAGKSTILEAIRLCLYGKDALGTRVSQDDYEAYIRERQHWTDYADRPKEFRIQLVFEHVHNETLSTYDAIRTWNTEGKSIREKINLYKNQMVPQDIAEASWGDFLGDLIPPGVADLFFFDAEQIKSLANSSTETDSLAKSIRGLLNLNLVSQLQSDLRIYLKQQKKADKSEIEKELEGKFDELEKLEKRYEKCLTEKAHINSQLDRSKAKLAEARSRLVGEGALLVDEREQQEKHFKDVETAIDQKEKQIRTMAAGLLPFAMVPAWNKRLKDRLEAEKATKRAAVIESAIDEKRAGLVTYLNSADFKKQHKLSNDTVSAIEAFLMADTDEKRVDILHQISDQARARLFDWIHQVENEIPGQLHETAIQLEILTADYRELSQLLSEKPNQLITDSLLDEFQSWAEKQNQQSQALAKIEAEIARMKLEKADLEREIEKGTRIIAEADGLKERVKRVSQTQVILGEYLTRMTKVKVAELEATFIDHFNQLARKKGFFNRIEIDPTTFETQLFDHSGENIPKNHLSAGEKQLYAMALLWSLRSVSGRVLPVIIDTPMGRLDSEHRQALLTGFFPNVAHQVIILSTDSEIDPEGYKHIEAHVTRSYQLINDETAGYTEVRNGYFEADGMIA